jgi:hypothetical protein
MKIDEDVPIMMPKMIVRAKPRITSPRSSQAQDRKNDGHRCSHRATEGMIDAQIDQRPQWHGPKLSEILSDTVVDDHLVGDRVADQSQQRRYRIEVKLDLGDFEEPHGLCHV